MAAKRKSLTTVEQRIFPYAMIAPNLIIFTLFIILPAFSGLWYSLHNWSGLGEMEFIGAENYITAFRDQGMWDAYARTLRYIVITLPFLMVVPLIFASLLIRPIKGLGIYRAILYWPAMISYIVAGIAFKFLFNDDSGIINYLITALGGSAVPWLTNKWSATFVVSAASIWSGAGYYMVMYITGLQAIPRQYYEAAQVDGATGWQQFRHITLPLLKPTTFMVLVLSLINLIKAYGLVISITSGGPVRATKYIVQFIYDTAFSEMRLGYASAQSMLLFLLVVVLTVIIFVTGKGGQVDDGN